MNARVESLRALLDEPLLVTDRTNLRYLTGFDSSNAALLVTDESLTLYSDFRYASAARAVEGVEFVETRRGLLGDLAERLAARGRIAFEADAVSYAGYDTLRGGGIELVPRRALVERLRAVKDEEELAVVRRASDVTTRAFAAFAEEPLVGRTERELAARLEAIMRELGAERLAFDAVIAAGPNAARPHAEPGDRVVARGDVVVVDAGAVLDGYCSDCTRTFAAGPIGAELGDAYALCLDAQLAALERIRPGMSGVEADRLARGVIEVGGHGSAFGHGLGHGVGLAVHEAPRLSPESTDTLAPRNVFSVEPGIYLEGRGGIRIEDLVVLHETGPEVLTRFTKEFVKVS